MLLETKIRHLLYKIRIKLNIWVYFDDRVVGNEMKAWDRKRIK